LIPHTLGELNRCWRIADDVKKGLRIFEFKCGKEGVLKDNINIRYKYKGYGWPDCHVMWSENGVKKTIPELKAELLGVLNKAEGESYTPTSSKRYPTEEEYFSVGYRD